MGMDNLARKAFFPLSVHPTNQGVISLNIQDMQICTKLLKEAYQASCILKVNLSKRVEITSRIDSKPVLVPLHRLVA